MFNIHFYFLAVVAAAPYDKMVFSDEFLDELRSKIFGKTLVKDTHIPNSVSPRMFFACSVRHLCISNCISW